MAKQYKIIKATYEKLVGVIFEYAIINDMTAPKGFTVFVEKQFKPLIQEVIEIKTDIIEIKNDVADIKIRVSNLENRMTNVETEVVGIKSNIATIFDILKRNNLN